MGRTSPTAALITTGSSISRFSSQWGYSTSRDRLLSSSWNLLLCSCMSLSSPTQASSKQMTIHKLGRSCSTCCCWPASGVTFISERGCTSMHSKSRRMPKQVRLLTPMPSLLLMRRTRRPTNISPASITKKTPNKAENHQRNDPCPTANKCMEESSWLLPC